MYMSTLALSLYILSVLLIMCIFSILFFGGCVTFALFCLFVFLLAHSTSYFVQNYIFLTM